MTSGLFVNVRAALNGTNYSPAGAIFAVDGTAYPGAPFPPVPSINDGSGQWSGFSSGIVGGLINMQDGLWESYCIGYPAATIPMWPSVQVGRANLINSISSYTYQYAKTYGSYEGMAILITGYSQGAMVTDQVWVNDILSPTGVLNYILPYVYRVYNFGDPFRCPGVANGNTILSNLPVPPDAQGEVTGGIGGSLDLTVPQTNYTAPDGKPVVMSCANPGDIYASCPIGTNPSNPAGPGIAGNLFFKIVMQPTFTDVVKAAEVLKAPIKSIEEGINAGSFFAQGTNAPHWQYFPQLDACINDALTLGNSLPHAGC